MNSGAAALLGLAANLVVASSAWGQAPAEALKLGVTTHFSQGWPARYWDLVETGQITSIRDSLHWRLIEATPGQIIFTDANSRHVRRACDAGKRVLLGIDPRNPLYDSGQTAFSPEARAAFAHYILAIADRFGDCIAGVEIGNEINAKNNMTGTAALDRPKSYTAIVKAVHDAVKPAHPAFQILGGSTNMVATGFLDRLFDAGALAYIDGVVVHPYRQDPANLDWELARLTAAIRRHGVDKPIWATEFSRDFTTPEDAPPFLAKMVTLMSAAGIEDAYWYALVDQKYFPTMGLYTAAGSPKPAALAYDYMAREMLSRGRAIRVNPGDHSIFHFRFGADRQIIWGARRPFSISGKAVFRDSQGHVIPQPHEIGENPVIIEGDAAVELGSPNILADSLYGYGEAPWSYFAKRGTAAPLPLVPIDWNWTTFIGHPALKPIAVNQLGLTPGGNAFVPIPVTVRYTAEASGQVYASACIAKQKLLGDGVTLQLAHDGVAVGPAEVVTNDYRATKAINLVAGDTIDFIVGPNRTPLADSVRYRFRIALTPQDAATC